jgi:hypothetical protein
MYQVWSKSIEEHSRINILQWILTKLGTYLVLRRVWNPIDFQSHRVQFLPCNILVNTLESTSFKIGFQILLRIKYVPSLVKIHWRMLILECSQGCYGRTDGSVTISHCNFVGEGIITYSWEGDRSDCYPSPQLTMFFIDFQSHRVQFLPCNILVNTLESTSFNGFWPNLVHT